MKQVTRMEFKKNKEKKERKIAHHERKKLS